MIRELGLQTARQLIDFSGGKAGSEATWDLQLRGAVAIHNILSRHHVAYLADEVGMGKTYVALGAVALLRHFNPKFRVLYIAPSENLQRKWEKELRNFTASNWLVVDNRVKSFHGGPAYDIAVCSSLASIAREAVVNPNRDFLVRASSFSFALTRDSSSWLEKRRQLLEIMPWLDSAALDLREKERFKQCYAAAVNAVIPHFDLVVVDEAHNLKHGLAAGAAVRNHLLALVLGSASSPAGIRRVQRKSYYLLLLSATPLESDYQQLWNQLQVFGQADPWQALRDSQASDAEKEGVARRFMVRRLTSMRIGGKQYTKNLYRREWRNGGVHSHDEPLPVAGQRERLVVGLVQKKVAEVLCDTSFKNSFQIGMLASFESFIESTGTNRLEQDEESVFDDTEQTSDEIERKGIDARSVEVLAKSYRKEFGTSLPHPKMDAVVDSLKSIFDSGEKVLVFVRRVRSVDEITEKLERAYDRWLLEYLKRELSGELPEALQKVFELYERKRLELDPQRIIDEDKDSEEDPGDTRTFFGWFFRGGVPPAYFSGASFDRNRLRSEGSAYSTLFDDNYVLWLLGVEYGALETLARAVGREVDDVGNRLRIEANRIFRSGSRQGRFPRQRVYRAYQQAAVVLLATEAVDSALRVRAQVVWRERYSSERPITERTDTSFPEAPEHLETRTFFSELRRRPDLRCKLWPEERGSDFENAFRRQEQRRELLVAVARLGLSFIDLWILAANRLGSLSAGTQERSDSRAEDLIESYLDCLEKQQAAGTAARLMAYCELSQVAEHFDLLVAVNFPSVRERQLAELPKLFGTDLSHQSPVAGMYGKVNYRKIRQFRMPGFPLLLVTTDILQEGEDLHTFCSRVVHYGIPWTPSSMEQRTGRIDRIHSLTHRRLDNRDSVGPEELLQVYYPHLRDTVERLQVERVYERINRFIRLLHRSLAGDKTMDSRVDVARSLLAPPRDILPILEPLTTAFDIPSDLLLEEQPPQPIAAAEETRAAEEHFAAMVAELEGARRVERNSLTRAAYMATALIGQKGVLAHNFSISDGIRQQPFALFLDSAAGGVIVIRCVSPIGIVGRDAEETILDIDQAAFAIGFAKVCAVENDQEQTYNLTVEADMLFGPLTTQTEEIIDFVCRTTLHADLLERKLLKKDESLSYFRSDLEQELTHG